MKKTLSSIFSIIILTAVMILPYFVFAQDPVTSTPVNGSFKDSIKKLETVAIGAGYSNTSSLQQIMGLIIKAAFSLLGIVFVILIIIGGYDWMMAEGNEQKVEKAQNYIRRAIIGLLITLSAWSIWNFIASRL